MPSAFRLGIQPGGPVPTALLAHLQAHEAPRSFIDQELGREGAAPVGQDRLAQRPGVMNEFKYLAEVHAKLDDESVLLARSMRLATPCGPLYERHISPDRELAALISSTGD